MLTNLMFCLQSCFFPTRVGCSRYTQRCLVRSDTGILKTGSSYIAVIHDIFETAKDASRHQTMVQSFERFIEQGYRCGWGVKGTVQYDTVFQTCERLLWPEVFTV